MNAKEEEEEGGGREEEAEVGDLLCSFRVDQEPGRHEGEGGGRRSTLFVQSRSGAW